MLKNIRIGTRLTVGMTLTLVLVVAMILPAVLSNLSNITERAEERQLRDLHLTMQAALDDAGRQAVALITAVASSEEVARAFAQDDRPTLLALTEDRFKVLSEDFGVVQLQFHLPPAESYLRTHMPDRYGDDLSGFRHTVVETNRLQRLVYGLERGVAGIGVRGVIPMSYQGRHIGSAEVGLSFGQPFFEDFSQSYDVPVALYIVGDEGFTAFGSTIEGDGALNDAQKRAVMQGETVTVETRYRGRDMAAMAQPVLDFSGEPIGVVEIMIDRSEYVDGYNSALTSVLGIGALAVVIGIALALLISRSIVCPLKTTVTRLNDIAQGDGDLTARLDADGKNELADLARAFNEFVDHIQQLIKQVSAATVQLSAAAEELSATSEQTTDQVKQQQNETTQVATAMNEMTATVAEVADNANVASQAADAANTQAAKGGEVVTETIKSIHVLADEVETAATTIDKLSHNSEQISQVLEVIRDIAEQTNLLALNAAIEAARAGDAGRGFAVVASEVRTLASRTQKSTVDIQEMIEQLQHGASEAVHIMESSRNKARGSVEQASEADRALDEIANGVKQINDMNAQIAHAAEQQATVAEEINQNISRITDVVDQTASSSSQISVASDELARLAVELQGQVQRFKV